MKRFFKTWVAVHITEKLTIWLSCITFLRIVFAFNVSAVRLYIRIYVIAIHIYTLCNLNTRQPTVSYFYISFLMQWSNVYIGGCNM